MVLPENPYIETSRFVKFLVCAKKATYASGKKPDTLIGGKSGFCFQEEELTYMDIYQGNESFAGTESVSCDGTLFWVLNYHGGVIGLPKEFGLARADVFAFLRKALMNVSVETPFRGPTFFKDNLWRYTHWFMKNPTGFNGYEAIWYGPDDLCKTKIYELHFHCGLIA
ncbi:MAG: DUF5680 domain-containing protein [bacterium]|nr:DUF5680 domain-containing protein [bacterium]